MSQPSRKLSTAQTALLAQLSGSRAVIVHNGSAALRDTSTNERLASVRIASIEALYYAGHATRKVEIIGTGVFTTYVAKGAH